MKNYDPELDRTNNVSNLTGLPHDGTGNLGNSDNPEVSELGTHFAGAVHQHETRRTSKPVSIHEPDSPNPGPYDVRTGQYEVKKKGH